MPNNYLNDAIFLANIIETYYEKKVSIVTPVIDSDKQFPWYSVKFILYRTYKIVYEYERGYFSIYSDNQDKSGLCILFSNETKEKIDNKSLDESTIINNLKLLDSEIRLRLPDKFLAQFD